MNRMIEQTLYVVGNKFRSLSNGDTLLSFDEVTERARSGRLTECHLSIQQGVSESQHQTLKRALAGRDDVRVSSYFDAHRRCDSALTHKAKTFNTLIAEPMPLAEKDRYASILMIDDDCAELSDHVTGQHIQYMVLLEAARQMGNAVTQKFYSSSAKLYLAEALDSRFHTFVYPFETRLACQVTHVDLRSTGDGKMALSIDFVQRDKVVCQFSVSYTVLDRKFVASLEGNGLKTFLGQAACAA